MIRRRRKQRRGSPSFSASMQPPFLLWKEVQSSERMSGSFLCFLSATPNHDWRQRWISTIALNEEDERSGTFVETWMQQAYPRDVVVRCSLNVQTTSVRLSYFMYSILYPYLLYQRRHRKSKSVLGAGRDRRVNHACALLRSKHCLDFVDFVHTQKAEMSLTAPLPRVEDIQPMRKGPHK